MPATSHSPLATSSDDVLVKVENVGKIFCRDLKRSLLYGVRDAVHELLPFGKGRKMDETGHPELRPGEFWANKDISFELRRGECLGLIGRNGAGKTTLLKMLNGLIKPDTGSITMRGRVGALIALGAGFNPILTGRENIYVNASILGLSKEEVDSKIQDIIDFAEIGEFIDSPVQSYSSGMQVRLGFAVATALEPDVLILDEVLAVGDAAFRFKCYNRIESLLSNAAVLFVSHSMEQVAQICSHGLMLSKGRCVHFGHASGAITRYEAENSERKDQQGFTKCELPASDFHVAVTNQSIAFSDEISISLFLNIVSPVDILLRIQVYNTQGAIVSEYFSEKIEIIECKHAGQNKIIATLAPLHLKGGHYFLSVIAYDSSRRKVIAWSFKKTHFNMIASNLITASHAIVCRGIHVLPPS